MKITSLTSKPQLIKMTLDDEATVAAYGDVIEFWVWDKQPIDSYFRMAQAGEDIYTVLNIAKEMILDETGEPVITADATLPPDVAMRAFTVVMNQLGK
jgi:hypothetical protein